MSLFLTILTAIGIVETTSHQSTPMAQAPYMQALKGAAIAGSLFNAGSMTTSWRFLPSTFTMAQTSVKLALDEFAVHYWGLSKTIPPIDLATALICGGLAYLEHKANPGAAAWKLWTTGAALMPAGWIVTWTLMYKPSDKLIEMQKSPDLFEDENSTDKRDVVGLLRYFNALMGFRMLFPWAVGGVALAAVLTE